MWKRTPLHYAAREGQIEASQRLVELGGDLSAQDFLGRTPLHLAARKGHADLAVLLANLGSGWCAGLSFLCPGRLHLSLRLCRRAYVHSLADVSTDLNHPDRNPWPNNSGRSPLHWACYKGHAEVVYQLCELGADKEAVDAMKRTPLHWAARRGQADCVQVLLLAGANVHAVDGKQMKPVNLANSKESNAATQRMLHQATVKKILPTSLPVFPPQPVPAQNMNLDVPAQEIQEARQQVPVPRSVQPKPSTQAAPRPLSARAAPRRAAPPVPQADDDEISKQAAAGGGGGLTSLEEAVARARAQVGPSCLHDTPLPSLRRACVRGACVCVRAREGSATTVPVRVRDGSLA